MTWYPNSKLIKVSGAILIMAIFLAPGYLIGIAATNAITHHRLYPGWIRITDLPVPIAELLTPTDGYLYVRGIDDRIYRTCTRVSENPECWQEVDYYYPPEPESCSWI